MKYKIIAAILAITCLAALVIVSAGCQKPDTAAPTTNSSSPIAAIQADIEDLADDVGALQSTLANMETPADLRVDLNSLEDDVADLESSLADLPTGGSIDPDEYAALQVEVTGVVSDLTDASAELGQQAGTITTLQATVTEIQADIAALGTGGSGTPTGYQALVDSVAALNGALTALNTQVADIDSGLTTANAAVEALAADLAAVDLTSVEDVQALLTTINADLDEYADALYIIENQIIAVNLAYSDIASRPYARISKLMNSYLEVQALTSGEYTISIELYGTGLTTGTASVTTGYDVTQYVYGSGGTRLVLMLTPDDNAWSKSEMVEITFNGLSVVYAGANAIYLK